MWPNDFIGQEGFIAREPEERTTQTGKTLVKFTMFISKGKDDKKKSAPMDVVLWDRVAERFSGQKGDLVKVIGMLNPESWEDKTTGKTRYGWSMTGEDVTVKWRKEQTEMVIPEKEPTEIKGTAEAPDDLPFAP